MFSKTLKGFVLVLSAIGILFTTAQGALAEITPIKSSSLFTDVSNDHWSYRNIAKMNIRGVVKGYTDGSFGPDRPVTQLEAVLMAVKNMHPDASLPVVDNGDPLPINVPDWAKNGCRQELLFALDHGLILPSENNFMATAPATRAWITQLIVRMTGQTEVVAGLAGDLPPVTDSPDIPTWAQPYVNLALRYQLVSGYPDKSFKPNNLVTRAEMVSVLNRSEAFLDLGETVVRGKVVGVSGDSLFLMVNGNLKFYSVTPETCFLTEDGKNATIDDLEINSSVLVVAEQSSLKYIETLSSQAALAYFNGTVLKILPEEGVLVLKDAQDKIYTGVLAQNAYINSQTGQFDSLDDITPGTVVRIGANADNQIVSLMIMNAKNIGNNFVIYEISPSTGLIIFRDSTDSFKSFNYSDQVIVKVPGQRFAGINDLQPGDQVALTFSGNLITEIELLKLTQDALITGKVVLISPDTDFLTVRKDDNSLETFELAADVRLIIEGLSKPDIEDLIVNDTVELSVSGGSVKTITVKNRSYKSKISGKVIAVDSNNRIITVSDENYQLNAYEVNRDADIVINNREKSFSDIKTGMTITALLENNKVVYLANNYTVEGSIDSIDKDRRKITLKTNSVTKTFSYSKSIDVNFHNKSNTDIDDVKAKDYVELVIENDIITAINLREMYSSEVIKVSTSRKEITIRNQEGDSDTFAADRRLILKVPGISSPDIDDLSVGDDIYVTFYGDRLAQVEVK